MINENKFIRLFECCIPVKGYRHSVIMDMQRKKVKFVPNDLINIIQQNEDKSIKEIIATLDADDKETFLEYVDFLLEHELAFLLDIEEISFFPKMSKEWDCPNIITNAIVYLDQSPTFDLHDFVVQLDSLLCPHIYLIIPYDIPFAELRDMIDCISNSSIQSIYVALNFNPTLIPDNIRELIKQFERIASIEIYDMRSNPYKNYVAPSIMTYSNRLQNMQDCGVIHTDYFSLNLQCYTESQNHNTCLNRKLCIDADGNIKNCISMNRSFGNIKSTTLLEAIEKEGFKDLWFITKYQIDVCKDCEFRYMCTDCRCFIKDPDNIYSQPAKCTYNPYIAKWAGEDGYVPVEECGSYNKETGFVPDIEKIAAINEKNNQQ